MRMWLDPVTVPDMGPLSGNMHWKPPKLGTISYKAISNILFYISASYFLEMFMSIR